MKIKKVFRQNGCNCLIAFIDDCNCIKVDFFPHTLAIRIDVLELLIYYADDKEYHEVSIESFHRALRLAKFRINKVIE